MTVRCKYYLSLTLFRITLSFGLLIFPVAAFSQVSTASAGSSVDFRNFSQQLKKGAIGVGMAAVRFDTKIRFTNKQTGNSVFIDPEGHLDLPEIARVNTVYAAYRFGEKHTIGAAYFAVKRENTFFSESINLEDMVVLNGQATLSDDTKFYFIDYRYTLFQDYRSNVAGVLGIAGVDLKYTLTASGEIVIDGTSDTGTYSEEASVTAPLPMLGLDFLFAFTPKWSMSTKVALVAGSYDNTSAFVFQTRLDARYRFTKHVGGVIGLSFFNADVEIDKDSEQQEIGYSFGGAFFGLHFAF
ncbi:hypothetical protein [Kaarinaea lacus]